MSRPRSASVCHHEARRPRSGSASPCSSGDLRPHLVHSLHLLLERSRARVEADGLDAEVCGELWPHPAPAEDVAVHHIERLVRSGRRGGGPDHLLGENGGVGHVRDAVPLRLATRKDEGATEVLADRGVGRERESHIHQVADGVADHGVGAVHRPREALPLRRGEELVLLRVIEVRHVEPGLVFMERRVGHLSLGIGVERAQIVLEPRHQGGVHHRRSVEGREQVTHHAAVHRDVLLLGRLARPRREEHVADASTLEGLAQALRRPQVRRNPFHAGGLPALGTGQREHPPSIARQGVDEGRASDARRADHQGHAVMCWGRT